MVAFWFLLFSIALYVFASFLEGFANALHGKSNFGLLYLLVLPLAFLFLPLKMAFDMMAPRKRR